jgi:hypothetical protein
MHASHDYINRAVGGFTGKNNHFNARVECSGRSTKAGNFENENGLRFNSRHQRSVLRGKSEQGFERALRKATEAIAGASIQILKTIGKTIIATLVTAPVTYLAVKEAYETRGYFAVGGEWLLMIGMVVVVLMLIDSKLGVTHDK